MNFISQHCKLASNRLGTLLLSCDENNLGEFSRLTGAGDEVASHEERGRKETTFASVWLRLISTTCLSNLDDVMPIIWKYWLLVAIYYFINHQNPCFSPHRMQQWFIFHSRACAFFFHWHAVSLHQEILPRTCIRLVKMIEKTNKQTLNYEKEEKLLLKFCFTPYAVSCTFFRWSGYVLACSRFPAKKSRHIKKPLELVKKLPTVRS